MQGNFNFSNKQVLVVGASRAGIGAAIADGFAHAGATVVITGKEEEPIESYRGRYKYYQLDVADEAGVKRLAVEIPELDVLINCAGMANREIEWSNEGFKRVIDVNLVGMLNLANAFKPHLTRSKGVVVATASMFSFMGCPRIPAYGASKAAVAQLVQSLAVGWAPEGIRVNAIAPGFIVTEQTVRGRADPVHFNRVVNRTPMARWGEPSDMVGPVLFLASPEAKFVTGVTLPVDGGLTANL